MWVRTEKDHFPYIIHRTSIGCYERTLALLLEKICRCTADLADANTGNDYSISEKHHDYAQKVLEKLRQPASVSKQIGARRRWATRFVKAQLKKDSVYAGCRREGSRNRQRIGSYP